jgi:cell division septation protein DedD
MRGYFDDEDLDQEEPKRDKELTLGGAALAALFLGLVLICGICFTLGYAVGHHGARPEAAAAQPPAAPDAEPLQGSGSIPKPDAAAQAPVPQPAQSSDNQQAPSDSGAGSNPAPAQANQEANRQGSVPANPPQSAAPNQPQVRPALGGRGVEPGQPSTTSATQPAMPSMSQYMVEIAAVRNAEDANVLTNALRKRNYPVTERREPLDGMIHVRIGPFPTHDEANRWRMKLQDDWYNAEIEP